MAAVPAASAAGRPVAETQPGTTAAEFRARFAQTGDSGQDFHAYGYITAADAATEDDLFAGALLNESTALLTAFAEQGANLIEVEHIREGIHLHVRETGVHATFEVRGRDHAASVVAAVRAGGHPGLRVDPAD